MTHSDDKKELKNLRELLKKERARSEGFRVALIKWWRLAVSRGFETMENKKK